MSTAYITMTVEEADRVIRALEAAKQAARRDAHMYGNEGVQALIQVTAESGAVGPRVSVETMESWIGSITVTDLDGE